MDRKVKGAWAAAIALSALLCGAGASSAPLAEGLAASARVSAPAATVALGEPVALDVWLDNVGGAGFEAPARLEDAGMVAEITDARGVVRRMNAASVKSMLRSRAETEELAAGAARGQRVVIDRDPSTGAPVFDAPGVYTVRFEVGGYRTAEAATVTVREPIGFEREALNALRVEEARLRGLATSTAAERLAAVLEREEADRRFIRRFEGTPYARHRRLALAASVVVDYSGARRPGYAEAEALLSAAADAEGFARRDEALADLATVRERQGKAAEAADARRRLDAIRGTPVAGR